MFARRRFKNKLVDDLEANEDMPLFDVLTHDELGPAVSNDSDDLRNYLGTLEGGRRRLDLLIAWALSDEFNTDEIREKYPVFQVNRNASSILSTPVRRMSEMFADDEEKCLYKQLKAFTGSDMCKVHVFAGHFQRIVEAQLRKKQGWMQEIGWDGTELVQFCIDHSYIQAYAFLLQAIVTEFPSVMGEETLSTLFKMVLEGAAKDVLNLQELDNEREGVPGQDQYVSICKTKRAYFSDPGFNSNNDNGERVYLSPISHSMGHVPRPQSLVREPGDECKNGKKADRDPRLRDKSKYESVKGLLGLSDVKKPVGEDIEKMRFRAYFLVNMINTSIWDDVDRIVAGLRTPEIMERLLICAIYSDDYSMVQQRAFRLVNLLKFGYKIRNEKVDDSGFQEIAPWDTKGEVDAIIESFAPSMAFSTEITPKMVSGFAVFSQYRYAELKDSKAPITYSGKYRDRKGCEYGSGVTKDKTLQWDQPFTWTSAEGRTPLEFYNYMLIEDPPISMEMNEAIYDALERIAQSIEAINTAGDMLKSLSDREWYEKQEYVLRQYCTYRNVMLSEFSTPGSEEGENMKYALKCAPWRLSVVTKSDAEKKKNVIYRGYRPAFNGHLAAWLTLDRKRLTAYRFGKGNIPPLVPKWIGLSDDPMAAEIYSGIDQAERLNLGEIRKEEKVEIRDPEADWSDD